MVDEVRLLRLLRSVSDDLAVLDREAGADADRRADPIWLLGVKYAFVTAIEGCVDAAQHVCASEGWGPPATNGDALALLGKHGVLAPEPAARLRQAVGFRNVLVHGYVDVDYDVVLQRLADPSDLRGFVDAVTVWLSAR